MLNRVIATKNKLVDYITTKERLRAIKSKREKQKPDYEGIKAYIQRKELGRF